MQRGRITLAMRAVIGVLAVVMLAAVDMVLQNISMSRIVTVSDDIQDVLLAYRDGRIALDAEFDAIADRFDDPADVYAWRASELAREALPPLDHHLQELDRVIVLPWHARIDLARETMHGHTFAWTLHLERLAEDRDNVFRPSFGSVISGTWRVLGVSLPEAVPRVDLADLDGRIAAFLADGEAPPGR